MRHPKPDWVLISSRYAVACSSTWQSCSTRSARVKFEQVVRMVVTSSTSILAPSLVTFPSERMHLFGYSGRFWLLGLARTAYAAFAPVCATPGGGVLRYPPRCT